MSYVRPIEREKSRSRRSLREGERDRDKSGPSMLWPSTGAQHTPLTLIASISIPGSPATPRTLVHFPTFTDQNTGTKGLLSGFKVDLTPPYFLDMGDMGDPPKSKLCLNVYICVQLHLLLKLAICNESCLFADQCMTLEVCFKVLNRPEWSWQDRYRGKCHSSSV